MLRLWLLVGLLFSLSACTHVWTPRTVLGCYLSAGDPQLDRERSYYALLLALSERNYEILHAELPRQIEVAYHSDYAPQRSFVSWLIDVREDASFTVQSIPPGAEVTSKQERWFDLLAVSVRRFSCRDLNWLRWEAQNKGLLPMADALDAAAAGGEQPATPTVPPAVALQPLGQGWSPPASGVESAARPGSVAPVAVPPAPKLSLSAPAVAARIAELRRERAQLSMRLPAALLITGGALGLSAIGFAIPASIDLTEDCTVYGPYDDVTCPYERGERLAIVAGSLAAGAVGFAITGALLLARRNRKLLRIRRELQQLTVPVTLSGGFDGRAVNLSLRGAF